MDEPRHAIVDILFALIKYVRESKGLTIETLADYAGIHRTYLGLLERGERQPTISVAIKLAEALGFHLSDLLIKSELIYDGKLKVEDAFISLEQRVPKPNCLRNLPFLYSKTGITGQMLLAAIQNCYNTLDLIDTELTSQGLLPIANLVELANLSSMVGNIIGGTLAEASQGLYKRNRPHSYPDLIPLVDNIVDLELKMALETNRPKGHLPKAGYYICFRYVLGTRLGNYLRGKEYRGNTVWIWEVKFGYVSEDDFNISNTEGDSGKTAVVKTEVFNKMPLIYFDPLFCANALRNHTYPGWN